MCVVMALTAVTCGAAVFPGLFFSFRKILRSWFTHWTEADVVCVSERSELPVYRLLLIIMKSWLLRLSYNDLIDPFNKVLKEKKAHFDF